MGMTDAIGGLKDQKCYCRSLWFYVKNVDDACVGILTLHVCFMEIVYGDTLTWHVCALWKLYTINIIVQDNYELFVHVAFNIHVTL